MGMFSLKDKTVILTGATGYLGKYFARALADFGAHVILIGRNQEKLDALLSELKQSHPEGQFAAYCFDQYDHDESKKQYEKIIETEKKIDVLINNAFDFSKHTGFNDPSGRWENVTYEKAAAMFDSAFYWAFQAMQIFGPLMKKQGNGSIINIGTFHADHPPMKGIYEGTTIFNPIIYGPQKAALKLLTKRMAVELAPEVRVNMISPGPIPNTEGKSANAITKDDPVLSRLSKRILFDRMGRPTDLTGALIYFASDASGWTTGVNFLIDGGYDVA